MIAPAFLLLAARARHDRREPVSTSLENALLLLARRGTLGLQGLRVEADIEDVGVADRAGGRRIDQIVGDHVNGTLALSVMLTVVW